MNTVKATDTFSVELLLTVICAGYGKIVRYRVTSISLAGLAETVEAVSEADAPRFTRGDVDRLLWYLTSHPQEGKWKIEMRAWSGKAHAPGCDLKCGTDGWGISTCLPYAD